MKKLLKIFGVLLCGVALIIAAFFGYNMFQTHKALNAPRLAENYYEDFEAGGPLEEYYSGKGGFDVKSIIVPSSNKSITTSPAVVYRTARYSLPASKAITGQEVR